MNGTCGTIAICICVLLVLEVKSFRYSSIEGSMTKKKFCKSIEWGNLIKSLILIRAELMVCSLPDALSI